MICLTIDIRMKREVIAVVPAPIRIPIAVVPAPAIRELHTIADTVDIQIPMILCAELRVLLTIAAAVLTIEAIIPVHQEGILLIAVVLRAEAVTVGETTAEVRAEAHTADEARVEATREEAHTVIEATREEARAKAHTADEATAEVRAEATQEEVRAEAHTVTEATREEVRAEALMAAEATVEARPAEPEALPAILRQVPVVEPVPAMAAPVLRREDAGTRSAEFVRWQSS